MSQYVSDAFSGLIKAHDDLNELICEICTRLLDSDEVITGLTAETNAYMWGVDELDIHRVEYPWVDGARRVIVYANFQLAGDHDQDKMFMGDTIVGSLEVVLLDENEYEVRNVVADLQKVEDRFGG